jgi:signal transduction histidine kinase
VYVPKWHDGAVVGLYVLATDIAELPKSNERIRDLAQRIETIREEERRSIAFALHEGIAQDLFAIKLGLDRLRSDVADSAAVLDACQELTSATENCMLEIRQIVKSRSSRRKPAPYLSP